jgi:tRNA 2-thiocytidine biosynthesis protein TtcA
MKEMQKLLSRVRSCVDRYSMIKDGDRIAVGVSGGKDSLALLCVLSELRKFYPEKYDLCALMLDMGFDASETVGAAPSDTSEIAELCSRLGVEFHVKRTEIARVIFDVRKESNPCSLCARMRRGSLHDLAKEYGVNKLALGHHFDDAAETVMLNLFFEARIGCFSPVTYLSRKDLTMIRPLLLTEERDIKTFVKKASLPVMKSPCPMDKTSERAKMKDMLHAFDREHRGLYTRIVGAVERGGIDGWHE